MFMGNSVSISHLGSGALGLQMCAMALGFLHGFQGSNTGPRACMASSFTHWAMSLYQRIEETAFALHTSNPISNL